MTRTEKKQRMETIVQMTARFSGAGISPYWTVTHTRYGVWLRNTIEVRTTGGTKVGVAAFELYFLWDEPLCDYKLHFVGQTSAYLNRKHGLREFLADATNGILEHVCKGESGTAALVGRPA